MALLAFPFLLLLHSFYSIVTFVRFFWRTLFKKPPSPLTAQSRKTPKHLSILFVTDNEIDFRTTEQCLLESIENTIRWCQELRIERLSVYDQEGIIARNSRIIQFYYEYQETEREVKSKLIDMVYPPTPPASDAGSRPLSPDIEIERSGPVMTIRIPEACPKKRLSESAQSGSLSTQLAPLTLHVVSEDSGKHRIGSIATGLAQQHYLRSKYDAIRKPFQLTVSELQLMIEETQGFPPPDFMIVHPLHPSKYNRAPLELHGFPPWQIRLTEIYHNRSPRYKGSRLLWMLPQHLRPSVKAATLTESEFREALDHFAGVEMRFGK